MTAGSDPDKRKNKHRQWNRRTPEPTLGYQSHPNSQNPSPIQPFIAIDINQDHARTIEVSLRLASISAQLLK